MRQRLAPALALLFFTAACAIVVADPWLPPETDVVKLAIVAMALAQASILWAYFGVAPPPGRLRRGHRGRRRAA
jgi:hypothetical protein